MTDGPNTIPAHVVHRVYGADLAVVSARDRKARQNVSVCVHGPEGL